MSGTPTAGAAALHLAARPRAPPAEAVGALAAQAVLDQVTGAGPGSPNRLRQVDNRPERHNPHPAEGRSRPNGRGRFPSALL
ncbi:hypothetical protein [Streptomyces altiplanensis]